VRDKVSDPYITTGKILIFKFLESRREDKRFLTECSKHSGIYSALKSLRQ
jgi:hypothetical protein